MAQIYKKIIAHRTAMVLSCDGKCDKAWGISKRPIEQLNPEDEDDFAWLADGELGTAPADPGTYEGGDAKPESPQDMNRWCFRECERSVSCPVGEVAKLPDFSKRVFNMSQGPEYE